MALSKAFQDFLFCLYTLFFMHVPAWLKPFKNTEYLVSIKADEVWDFVARICLSKHVQMFVGDSSNQTF